MENHWRKNIEVTIDIKEQLANLPHKPGVYLHKDKHGEIIYVGKAISLKNRVRQYFQSKKNMDAKTATLSQNIVSFEYITTDTEMEALLLECNLIKKYMPKYNILLRDDKTYPYIKITDEEKYPRLIKTRNLLKNKGKYFGPYTDVGAVNRIIDLLNSIFQLKRCNIKEFPVNFKPCLNYHIKQCDGVCLGNISQEKYLERIKLIEEFLKGKNQGVLSHLKNQMEQSSINLQFEQAAKFRDYIEDVKKITEKQKVSSLNLKDLDIVLSINFLDKNSIVLFFVRDGKLCGREIFTMKGTNDKKESVKEFIKQHYTRVAEIPREIMVEEIFHEQERIQEFLTDLGKRKVKINIPIRGEKKALLTLAQKNAQEILKNLELKEENKRVNRLSLINELKRIDPLQLPEKLEDFRVEAYDISNTQGVDSVGAMVVFYGEKPARKEYRKFKIKTIEGADDYGSLQEMIIRRIRRGQSGDKAFLPMPHLIIMDGGKGQVTSAKTALEAVGERIPIIGLAKDDNHRTDRVVYINDKTGNFEEILLKEKRKVYHYFSKIQEEVHQYAITYHRKIREKSMYQSELDNINGIGSKMKKKLLQHFKSVENISAASLEELKEVRGVGDGLANLVYQYFHKIK